MFFNNIHLTVLSKTINRTRNFHGFRFIQQVTFQNQNTFVIDERKQKKKT